MKIEGLIDNSIIIINKPPGKASHEITTWVKRIVGAKRAGHAGTLDPNVSGVLPIALGRATKLLRYMAGKEKAYVGIIKFKKLLDENEIKSLFKRFVGVLTQTPPKQSAVRKVPRKRTVYSLEFLEISESNPRLVLFKTRVDAGTYIRTLCEDMGKLIGGARMEELRRTAVGTISENQTKSMQDLIDAIWLWKNKNDDHLLRKMIRAPEEFIDLPRIIVKESAVKPLLNGAQLTAPGVKNADEKIKKHDRVAIYSEDLRFLGIGVSQVDGTQIKIIPKGIVVKIERIHLQKY